MCAYTHGQEKEGKQLISNILVLEADTANKIIINKHRGWDLEMGATDPRTIPRSVLLIIRSPLVDGNKTPRAGMIYDLAGGIGIKIKK